MGGRDGALEPAARISCLGGIPTRPLVRGIPEIRRAYFSVLAAQRRALLPALQYQIQRVVAGGAADAAVVRVDADVLQREECCVRRRARRSARQPPLHEGATLSHVRTYSLTPSSLT
jgi:hypothetical protein